MFLLFVVIVVDFCIIVVFVIVVNGFFSFKLVSYMTKGFLIDYV